MIEVTVKETAPTTVAFAAMKGSYGQMPGAFGKLYGWIGQKGYVPAGPPLGIYFDAPGQVPEDQLRWELRSPIAGYVPTSGPDEQGLGVKSLPPGLVASTLHKGAYEGIGKVYEALAAWIYGHGYEIAGPTEEVYLTDPSETAPEDYLTEVRFPVKKS